MIFFVFPAKSGCVSHAPPPLKNWLASPGDLPSGGGSSPCLALPPPDTPSWSLLRRRHHGNESPSAPTTPTLARRKAPGGLSDFYSLGLEEFPSGTALILRSAECWNKDEKPRVMFYL